MQPIPRAELWRFAGRYVSRDVLGRLRSARVIAPANARRIDCALGLSEEAVVEAEDGAIDDMEVEV